MDIETEITELPDLGGFRIEAFLPNGNSIGYANVLVKGTVADLCDLCVKDSYRYLWPHFMPVFLSIQRKRNFQNKGIGSKLLATAIEHSIYKGCAQMKGWMHGDIARLKKFYSSFGFEVCGINIELDLKKYAQQAAKDGLSTLGHLGSNQA